MEPVKPANTRGTRDDARPPMVTSPDLPREATSLNRPLAFAMASVSAVFLAFVSVLGQLATREVSVIPALFFRFLASGLVVLLILRSEAWTTLAKIGRLEWLRVGSVLISQFCLFLYLEQGSLLIGVLLYNTGPLFSPLLARVLLGITFGIRTVVSLALGFAGVVLVLNPFDERLDAGVPIALASGFFNACSQLAFHQMSRGEAGPLRTLFPFYALLTLCSAVALPFSWQQSEAAFEHVVQWPMLALIAGLGVFGVLNQSTKSIAYRNVRNPANLGPFLYLSLVVAAIFDWILYSVVPTPETFLGGSLIFCSALAMMWRTLFERKA